MLLRPPEGFKINLDGVDYTTSGSVENGLADLVVNGEKVVAHINQTDSHITVMYKAQQTVLELIDKHYISEHESDALPLAAPLNGTVVKHLVEVGSTVAKGDAVVIIEAMKMEYTLNAPHDGVLTSYCFAEGELVSHGDMLAIVEEPEA